MELGGFTERLLGEALLGNDDQVRGWVSMLEVWAEEEREEQEQLEEAEREEERIKERVLSSCEERGHRRLDAEVAAENVLGSVFDGYIESDWAETWLEITLDVLEMEGRHKHQVVSECVKRGYIRRDAVDTFERVWGSHTDFEDDLSHGFDGTWLQENAGDAAGQFKALLEDTLESLLDNAEEQVLSACEERGYQRCDAEEAASRVWKALRMEAGDCNDEEWVHEAFTGGQEHRGPLSGAYGFLSRVLSRNYRFQALLLDELARTSYPH
jgi:hypothetical protein